MLTKEQIDALFIFCASHSVRHYDVQVELVDHLANAVEDKMAKGTSFYDALKSVHADFGILGFASVVNAKNQSLRVQYSKAEGKLFRSYFTLPKISLTLCVVLALLLPLKFSSPVALAYFTESVLGLLFIAQMYFLISNNNLAKKQAKKLLSMEVLHYESWLSVVMMVEFFAVDKIDVFNAREEYPEAFGGG
jgi:hypothetical protein